LIKDMQTQPFPKPRSPYAAESPYPAGGLVRRAMGTTFRQWHKDCHQALRTRSMQKAHAECRETPEGRMVS